jgi:hypothetical protein
VQFGILALIVGGAFVVGIDSPLEIKGPVALVLAALPSKPTKHSTCEQSHQPKARKEGCFEGEPVSGIRE